MKLTDHQEEVVGEIINSLISGEKNIIIDSQAGTGKTTCAKFIGERFYNLNPNKKPLDTIYVLAPTNKAVSVIESKFKDIKVRNTVFTTIHSALNLKRKINEKTGDVTFEIDLKSKNEPFKNACLIIIDEASMINSEILIYLEDPKYKYIPKIYLGDFKQINPVNEDDSPIFKRIALYEELMGIMGTSKRPHIIIGEKEHEIPKYVEFELTEIVRQGKFNPIIDFSRNIYPTLAEHQHGINGDEGYMFINDPNKVIEVLSKDPENNRYLAWTNVEVSTINNLVRQKIYGYPSKIENGEIIVMSQPYEDFKSEKYYTNQEVKINKLNIETKRFVVDEKYKSRSAKKMINFKYEVNIDCYVINDSILIVHELSDNEFLNALNAIKKRCLDGLSWIVYFHFKERVASFHYIYAITVHKSQGSTYQNVIINATDLNKNQNKKEKLRLWYTGITRSAKKLYIYEPNRRNYL